MAYALSGPDERSCLHQKDKAPGDLLSVEDKPETF